MTQAVSESVSQRAKLSLGTSGDSIYGMVQRIIESRGSHAKVLVDVGCGAGNLRPCIAHLLDRYIGVDAVRYEAFPANEEFHLLNLDDGRIPLPDESVDMVVAVETIEHVENPRAFMRELVRLCQPGGMVIVTTPNQLSFLSKLTLLLKNQFNAFTETNYPAHLTALLEIDLRRIAAECGLEDLAIHYTLKGRLPGTAAQFPRFLSRLLPRGMSDNIAVSGVKKQTRGS